MQTILHNIVFLTHTPFVGNKKYKIRRMTDEEYGNYIAALKEERPVPVISDNQKHNK